MKNTTQFIFIGIIAVMAGVISFNYTFGYKSIQSLQKTVYGMKHQKQEVASGVNSDDSMKNYILTHPEVILDSINKFSEDQQAKHAQEVQKSVEENYDKIYTDNSFVIGNENAAVNMVVFFDYNCGHCKNLAKDIKKLINKNDNVKIYMKDVAILSQSSLTAAQASIAAGLLGKYEEFHIALMESNQERNIETYKQIASQIGLNPNDLVEMMESKKVGDILMENRLAASIVDLQGTPTIFVETKAFEGVPSIPALENEIRETLEKKLNEK